MTIAGIELPAGYRLVNVADEPVVWRPADQMCTASWPEFMLHDPVTDRCWDHLYDDWPRFQLVLLDDRGGVAAAAQAAPLFWDRTDEGLPDGWDDQFERSVDGLSGPIESTGRLAGLTEPARPTEPTAARTLEPVDRRRPNTLGAIQICIARDRRGGGLSALMLEAMKQSALDAGLSAVIACVRPTEKSRYPLMPIETYAAWRGSLAPRPRPGRRPDRSSLAAFHDHLRYRGRVARVDGPKLPDLGSVRRGRRYFAGRDRPGGGSRHLLRRERLDGPRPHSALAPAITFATQPS